MFPSGPRSLTFTLLFYLTLTLALSSTVEANTPHRRDHASLKRLIRKRAPQGNSGDGSGNGNGNGNGGGAFQPNLPNPALSSDTPTNTPASTPSTRPTSAAATTTGPASVSRPTSQVSNLD